MMEWVSKGENPANLLTQFFMDQSRGILWGMYYGISTMSISN